MNTLLNNLPDEAVAALNDEQRGLFIEVISESLRVSQSAHLFNWLQGSFQCLLNHEVMIYGVKTPENSAFEYNFLTCSRYFDDDKFHLSIKHEVGIVNQIFEKWKVASLPLCINNDLENIEYNGYAVANINITDLKNSEFVHFVAHGFGDDQSKISTFVIFARLAKQPTAYHAHILELIMPHLHCAIVRVTSSNANPVWMDSRVSKKITRREAEVLQWMHLGKTNWEISTILSISPLTVKNHVQNILRKLDVQNRGQAAIKAAKLGYIRIRK